MTKAWTIHFYENGFEVGCQSYRTRELARIAGRAYRYSRSFYSGKFNTRITRTVEFY